MEYLEGQTLAELLAERGRLEIVEALDILLPVLSAVAAAHALGVIHRDLKPENIFLAQDARGEMRPKVVDFGVSKLMDGGSSPTLTGPQAVLGTAAYMSPEQARGACEAEPSSDQYALGLILYEMLAGTRAQPGQNALEILHNISRLSIVRLRHHRPDCPQALEDIVMRMLSPTPEYRFPSLQAAGSALIALAGERTSRVLARTFGQPAGPAPRPASLGLSAERDDLTTQSSGTGSRRRVLVVVTGLVLAAIAGWVWARQIARQASPPVAPATASGPDRPEAAPPDLAVPAVTAAAASVPLEPERRHDSRRGKGPALPRASKAPEKVFDRREGEPYRPRRGVNDALIIE
jgi:serine/threonine-protein kinase